MPAQPEHSPAARKPAVWNREPLPHVRRVVAVASGKGGVGKSTVTVNLALALAARGLAVGILDADIYGPSIPRMLGLETRLQPELKEGRMLPPLSHGIKALSIALLTGDAAAILRAPMVTKALVQMLRGTEWGTGEKPLDLLLVDMPPGTGDIHLSLAQQVPLDGAIIVTTPQEIATADADKAAQMFVKTQVPLLGIVENMSWFADPAGQRHILFGEGGGQRLAETHRVKLLGSLPLDPRLGAFADAGKNYLAESSDAGNAFAALAASIATGLGL
jgi:ATP-binding protein involved in chromosome partitioning